MSNDTSNSEEIVVVPSRAAEWIGRVLRNAGGTLSPTGSLLLAIENLSDGDSSLDLRLMKGKTTLISCICIVCIYIFELLKHYSSLCSFCLMMHHAESYEIIPTCNAHIYYIITPC